MRDASAAARKAWRTMKKAEANMSETELRAVARRRSNAAHKAWKTIRARKKAA